MRQLRLLLGVTLMVVCVLVAGGMSGAAGQGTADSQWAIRDLGTLRGTQESEATGMNERGWIVGNSYLSTLDPVSRPYAFVRQGKKLVRLGTLGGKLSSAPAINGKGWIVGWSTTRRGVRPAFLWRNGRMADLGTLPVMRAVQLAQSTSVAR